MRRSVPVEVLRERFAYDPETGVLTTRVPLPRLKLQPGDALTKTNEKGYIRASVLRYTLFAHRIIWAMHYGEWPDQHVDHINRNRQDNRIANLRLATDYLNQANSGPRKGKYKGVRERKYGRWCAAIRDHGKAVHLGYFDTAEQAALAYNEAAIRCHGEFAVLNKIGDDHECRG